MSICFLIGCWLLAAGCWLMATGYWLLAAGYWLLATGYWLLATSNNCWLIKPIYEREVSNW
ncbi:MAG: hypothetical protein LWX70_06085 [Sphingobacteriia bacterium]|nr:hypothetical protein [Sphingobacteriia bacterium]